MIWYDGVHLASDVSLEELHEEAAKIGLKRNWLHNGKIPHYDVMGRFLKKIVKNCTSRELVLACRKVYENADP